MRGHWQGPVRAANLRPMGYPPRVDEPGLFVHVTANAVDGVNLFRNELDRVARFEFLAEQARDSGWIIFEWCQMTTHEHLLLQLTEPGLSKGFQRLQSRYARAYNRRHDRRGVVFQRRFHTEVITTEWHLFEVIRYIALNPVRARMVDKAEDWDWCSYGSAVGTRWRDEIVDERALLGLFARDRATARRRLRNLVEDGMRRSQRPL